MATLKTVIGYTLYFIGCFISSVVTFFVITGLLYGYVTRPDFAPDFVGIDRDIGYCNKIRSSSAFNQATLDNSVKYIYEELAQ